MPCKSKTHEKRDLIERLVWGRSGLKLKTRKKRRKYGRG
jgi:hypothetical protein